MIKNLPNTISTSIVRAFSFGDADARDDQLLKNCHVPTSAISELIQDHKDIVLGYRGTGKSAIVRLFEEGIFSFKKGANEQHTVLVLDEEFDYRAVRNHLQQNALKDQKPEDLCRAVWEVLIIYRVMTSIRSAIDDSDATLREYINEIEVLLGVANKKTSLVDILLSHKKKVGIKFDTFHPNIVDTYIGIEPSPEAATNGSPTVLKIGDYRKYTDRLLKEKDLKIYVLFDKLDDFVIHDDYETQKLLLQELLGAQRTYREKSQQIRIKIFFRTDLFERLDLRQFGADKIFARCINLTWKSADIKRFIAQRLGHNLLKNIPLPGFEFQIDKDRFFILRDELSLLEESKSLKKFNPLKKSHWEKLIFLVGIELRKKQTNEGRLTDAMDVIHEEIITSILPRELTHRKLSGEEAQIDIFKFLDSHLQFSHGETTPRAVLLFLDLCLVKLNEYYQQNSDLREITKDANGEFPLFVRVAISRAYREFHLQCWKIQYQWAQDWAPLVSSVEKFAHIGSFAFADFKKKANIDDADARQFLAFSTHTGLLKCSNEHDRLEERRYELPILYRKYAGMTTVDHPHKD